MQGDIIQDKIDQVRKLTKIASKFGATTHERPKLVQKAVPGAQYSNKIAYNLHRPSSALQSKFSRKFKPTPPVNMTTVGYSQV